MSNEVSTEVLQSMLQYYRAKCSKLEYEFLLYKTTAEESIKQIKLQHEVKEQRISNE